MSERRRFVMAHRTARANCIDFASRCPDGWSATFAPPKRTDGQNERFHAMCGDIAKQCMWMNKRRTPAQWKVLLVSGHAVATKEEAEMVPGLEGEYVNLRESTATMSVRRGASLIEYTRAYGDMNGVAWSEPAPHEDPPAQRGQVSKSIVRQPDTTPEKTQ